MIYHVIYNLRFFYLKLLDTVFSIVIRVCANRWGQRIEILISQTAVLYCRLWINVSVHAEAIKAQKRTKYVLSQLVMASNASIFNYYSLWFLKCHLRYLCNGMVNTWMMKIEYLFVTWTQRFMVGKTYTLLKYKSTKIHSIIKVQMIIFLISV